MLTKTRHNKKRNTAFIYEALVRELTKCIVAQDESRKNIIVSLVREHFGTGAILRQELDLYKTLYEAEDVDVRMCERLLNEVKRSHSELDRGAIFQEQTALINKINKMLSKSVFSNFVPNYKSLATISQILNPDVSIKHRVLLESSLVDSLSSTRQGDKEEMAPIDNIVYKTFVKKFNDQYNGKLLEGQEKLLSKYIASFHDNGIELKIFLNEELYRIKGVMNTALATDEISKDDTLRENTNKILRIVDSYKTVELTPEKIQEILKIQSLVEELEG